MPVARYALITAVVVAACGKAYNPLVCDDGTCDVDGGGLPDGGGGGGPDGGCAESWSCSYWEPIAGGFAQRTCVDVNACGTTAQKPSEGPTALPALNLNYFKCNVQPVLARTCAMVGCHGTFDPQRPFRLFARGRQRNNEVVSYNPTAYGCLGPTVSINLMTQASATATCAAKVKLTATEWQLSFDSARALALGVTPGQSELLAQPLRTSAYAHAGIKPWTTGSSEYITVLNWLNGQTAGTCTNNN